MKTFFCIGCKLEKKKTADDETFETPTSVCGDRTIGLCKRCRLLLEAGTRLLPLSNNLVWSIQKLLDSK